MPIHKHKQAFYKKKQKNNNKKNKPFHFFLNDWWLQPRSFSLEYGHKRHFLKKSGLLLKTSHFSVFVEIIFKKQNTKNILVEEGAITLMTSCCDERHNQKKKKTFLFSLRHKWTTNKCLLKKIKLKIKIVIHYFSLSNDFSVKEKNFSLFRKTLLDITTVVLALLFTQPNKVNFYNMEIALESSFINALLCKVQQLQKKKKKY
ncbi:hypothetical protein RFI_01532 [Reticulomyxa filosa]|uniref:Uncharacterized protein n=1 Tax=Reticulomyxa filosa TaxID=46433 RepID=X6PBN7_RETFI|nr:hypothetical protein RFI_01532 [Reticulomyxa filosa]|eukprot:ETO35533.1 hypothetical protein RFI_01532 [Reticulomyxa filosa]